MEFRILGPLEVLDDEAVVPLRGAKRRGVLALLVVHAGQRVSVERIVDAVWGPSASPGAARTVQTYVSQLRRLADDPKVRVVADEGAYRLEVPAEAVDASRFEQLVRQTGSIVEPAERVSHLDAALDLWRGRALEDFVDAQWAAAERARLETLRLQAHELRVEARLALGAHQELIGELEVLVDEHPLDERLWASLLVAYYRSGRQADALRAFQRLRTNLAEELGIEPSAELRDLERQILDQDPTLGQHATRPVAAPEEPVLDAASLPSGVVTFLLTDIVDSTLLWDHSASAMSEALARHDALLAEVVHAHGGRLLKAKGEGDATFSVFPRASDALVAAVEAQRALTAESWPDDTPIRVRMALVTGEAVERDGDYYGTTVNRAARLRALADGGEVLVAQSAADVVLDHLPDRMTLIDLGSRDLKDLDRPERVWRVADEDQPTSIRDAAMSTDAPETPLPSALAVVAARPLAARHDELDQLAGEFQHEERRVVWVRGEPGIGKTHLVAEAARRARADGAIVLYGHCDEDLGAPYQPFVEALRDWIAAVGSTTVAATGRRQRDLGRLLPDLTDVTTTTTTSGDAERFATFEAVDELLTDIATSTPVVLVLDDLHWAEHSSLLLLRHLARSARPARLTILATYRDTDLDRTHPLAVALADLRRDRTDTRIDVGPLDVAAVERLITGLGVDLDPETLATVAAETEGNPFFVAEVARHLAEAGPEHATVPEGIREVIGRRLSRLSTDANDALTIAAVVGRDFDAAVVTAAGGPIGEPLHAALDEAVHAHVLEEIPGSLDRYRFSHALIRQTLLAELPLNRRVRLHWAAGQALHEHQPTDVSAIAHHLTEGVLAGDVASAADACITAGDAAAATAAWDEAAAHHQRALDLLDHADVDEPDRRYRAHMRLNTSARAVLDQDRAQQSYLAAAAVAREQGWEQRRARGHPRHRRARARDGPRSHRRSPRHARQRRQHRTSLPALRARDERQPRL